MKVENIIVYTLCLVLIVFVFLLSVQVLEIHASVEADEPNLITIEAFDARCTNHQGISTCLVNGCEGYGCTTCISCGKTLTGPETWEFIKGENE